MGGRSGANGRNGIDGKDGKNGEDGKDADVKFLSVKVPVCRCYEDSGEWKVKKEFETVKAIANKAGTASNKATIISEHEELYKANSELCLAKNNEFEAYLSVPDYWQTKVGQRPQLAIQFGELINGKLGRSRWTLIIPHYKYGESYNPKFLDFKKGSVRGIKVLNDNSHIIVWCKTKSECKRVINNFLQYVPLEKTKGSLPIETVETNRNFKQALVTPTLCQYFPTGQKDELPLWSKKLRDKK